MLIPLSPIFKAFYCLLRYAFGDRRTYRSLGRLLAPALYLPSQMSDDRRFIVASGLLQGILLRRRRSPLPRRRSLRRSPLPRWRLPRRSPLPRRRSLLSVFLRLLVLGVRLHLGGARWSLGWTLGLALGLPRFTVRRRSSDRQDDRSRGPTMASEESFFGRMAGAMRRASAAWSGTLMSCSVFLWSASSF